MKRLRLTDEDWRKLLDLNAITANNLRRKLPSDWPLTHEEISGAVYDTIIHLLGRYTPGALSPVSYCWEHAGRDTYRDLIREYRRLKAQVSLDGMMDDGDEVRHEIGVGDVPALTVDERQHQEAKDAVSQMLERATPKDRKIMQRVMDGKTLREIGEEMHMSQVAVQKRLKKYGREG